MIIVESKMVTGQIQLGVKKGSEETLVRLPTQGFFYANSERKGARESWRRRIKFFQVVQLNQWKSVPLFAAPNFSDSRNTDKQSGAYRRQRIPDNKRPNLRAKELSCLSVFFYDNPSSKRDARCTNILPTGATLSGVGEGQRLRKGFQVDSVVALGDDKGDRIRNIFQECLPVVLANAWCSRVGNPTNLESLSSAAKIRHSARNTRL